MGRAGDSQYDDVSGSADPTKLSWLVKDATGTGTATKELLASTLSTLIGGGGGGGGVSDGDKGDIVISGTGTVYTIDTNAVTTSKIANSSVTYAKMQNVSATDRLLGRSTAGAGVVEEITCTSFARQILDDADATAVKNTIGAADFTSTVNSLASLSSQILNLQPLDSDLTAIAALTTTSYGRSFLDRADATAARTHLGLGTLATLSAVSTAQLTDANVTYAKIQNVSATDRLLGRSTAGAGVIEEIACTSFGRNLIDDADATAARVTLGLGALATLSAVGTAQITDANVTLAKLANSGAASVLLGRGAGSGAGAYQELTLGSGLSLSGTVLSASGGGGGTPGGSDTQVQFNNAGAFGGSANFTWNGSTVAVTGGVTLSGTLTVGATPLVQDAADVLAQRRSTNAQLLRVYETYTDGTTFSRGVFGFRDSASGGTGTGSATTVLRIGTEAGSVGGTARQVEIISGGARRLAFDTVGLALLAGGGSTAAYFQWGGELKGREFHVGVSSPNMILAPDYGGLRLGTTKGILWGNTDTNVVAGTADLGLSRASSNILGITNGSTGGGAIEFTEMTAPATPATNKARVFARDNGSGKTQVCIILPDGVVTVLATET